TRTSLKQFFEYEINNSNRKKKYLVNDIQNLEFGNLTPILNSAFKFKHDVEFIRFECLIYRIDEVLKELNELLTKNLKEFTTNFELENILNELTVKTFKDFEDFFSVIMKILMLHDLFIHYKILNYNGFYEKFKEQSYFQNL